MRCRIGPDRPSAPRTSYSVTRLLEEWLAGALWLRLRCAAGQCSDGSVAVRPASHDSSVSEAGAARQHQFASDIIQKFGGASLLGSRIYFISNRGGTGQYGNEVWVMDWDGGNQHQLTHLGRQLAYTAVSPDGSRLAVTSWPVAGGQPRIDMINTDTGRTIPFYNQDASLNAAANFTPDGKRISLFSRHPPVPRRFIARGSTAGDLPASPIRGGIRASRR